MANAKETQLTFTVNYPHGLNLRQEATKDSPVVEVLPVDAEVEATGDVIVRDGVEWLPVRAASEQCACVMKEFLTAKAAG